MEQTLTYPDRPLQVGDLVMYSFFLDTIDIRSKFATTEHVFQVIELHPNQDGNTLISIKRNGKRIFNLITKALVENVTTKSVDFIDIANLTHISHQQSEQLRGLKLANDLNIT